MTTLLLKTGDGTVYRPAIRLDTPAGAAVRAAFARFHAARVRQIECPDWHPSKAATITATQAAAVRFAVECEAAFPWLREAITP